MHKRMMGRQIRMTVYDEKGVSICMSLEKDGGIQRRHKRRVAKKGKSMEKFFRGEIEVVLRAEPLIFSEKKRKKGKILLVNRNGNCFL